MPLKSFDRCSKPFFTWFVWQWECYILHWSKVTFLISLSDHNFFKPDKVQITKWQRVGRVYLAGAIALVVGLIIWITSLPPIRRKNFEFFYYAHHLYMVFIVFFLLHAGDRHFYLVFSGVLLFALDKILRIIQSRQAISLLSACIVPGRAIELTLRKPHCESPILFNSILKKYDG